MNDATTRLSAPPSFRAESWKFAFTGSRCQACGARHVPPQRVCVKCHAVDRMAPERLADIPATIATFTVDRLAYSPDLSSRWASRNAFWTLSGAIGSSSSRTSSMRAIIPDSVRSQENCSSWSTRLSSR